MKPIILVMALSLILCSCGSRGYWTKTDFDVSKWQTDSYECRYRAEMVCYANAPGGGEFRGIAVAACVNDHFKMCIQSRGYYWVKTK